MVLGRTITNMNTSTNESTTVIRLRSKKRGRPLTPKERRDQLLLVTRWEVEEKIRDISRIQLADIWGVGKSVPGKYLNGAIALSVEWKMNFALYLDCKPQDIWPDWEYTPLTADSIPPSLQVFAVMWRVFASEVRVELLKVAQKLYARTPKRIRELASSPP
jgi:hypothetical protein